MRPIGGKLATTSAGRGSFRSGSVSWLDKAVLRRLEEDSWQPGDSAGGGASAAAEGGKKTGGDGGVGAASRSRFEAATDRPFHGLSSQRDHFER